MISYYEISSQFMNIYNTHFLRALARFGCWFPGVAVYSSELRGLPRNTPFLPLILFLISILVVLACSTRHAALFWGAHCRAQGENQATSLSWRNCLYALMLMVLSVSMHIFTYVVPLASSLMESLQLQQ